MNEKEIAQLPPSSDEFWDGEKHVETPKVVPICTTHSKDKWRGHDGYKDNGDGTISCVYCGWGTRIAGYYRVVDGKIVDLRSLGS